MGTLASALSSLIGLSWAGKDSSRKMFGHRDGWDGRRSGLHLVVTTAPIPFLRALSSPPCLALSLPFLFGVEDQVISA